MPPPVNQTRQLATPIPSTSREAYNQQTRDLAIQVALNGHFNDPQFVQLRQLGIFPSRPSVHRWLNLFQREGHYRACVRNGNITAEVLRDHNLILIAIYRIAHPKASHAEINAFLYNCNYGNPLFRFYDHSQLSKAETILNLTTKAGSTTAYQAYLPINIFKRWVFWNMAYPAGIADIRRQDMIDIDEAGIFLKTSNRKSGKAHKCVRVNSSGPYQNGGEKWTLMLGVCGETGTAQNPSRRWRMTWVDGGTTIQRVVDFILMILNDIGPGTAARRYCFTMDNLAAHHNILVAAIIHGAGHRLAFRAPYYPIDGPIEYVFNTIQSLLRTNIDHIHDAPSLLNELYNAIASIDDFASYFQHCGFWRN